MKEQQKPIKGIKDLPYKSQQVLMSTVIAGTIEYILAEGLDKIIEELMTTDIADMEKHFPLLFERAKLLKDKENNNEM